MSRISHQELYQFIKQSQTEIYTGNTRSFETPDRPGFSQYTFLKGSLQFHFMTSGVLQTHAVSTVYFKKTPIWMCSAAGGVYDNQPNLARSINTFVHKAVAVENPGFISFRGPHGLMLDNWEYTYAQEGDIEECIGHEEVCLHQTPVYYLRLVAGLIKD